MKNLTISECVFEYSVYDCIRLLVTFHIVFFFGCLPQFIESRIHSEQKMNEVLLKYYSKDEIVRNNIHRIGGRKALNLSNGVTLPYDDLVYVNNGTPFEHLFVIFLLWFFLFGLDYACGKKNIRFICWMLSRKIPSDVTHSRWVWHSIYKEYLSLSVPCPGILSRPKDG